MLIFDPSIDQKQFLREQFEIGTSPVWIQVRTYDQFNNAFKSLNKKEADLKRPLGIRVTARFGEYWVEGTNAWHKVIAFKQSFCRLDTKREETYRWINCGCISVYLCYHTAKAFDIHTKLSVLHEQHMTILAEKEASAAAAIVQTPKHVAKSSKKTLATV